MRNRITNRAIDQAVSSAAIDGSRSRLAAALRWARAEGMYHAARDWATWIGWPVRLPCERPNWTGGDDE